MSTLNSVLMVALCVTVSAGCVMEWNRDWPDASAQQDAQGDRGAAPDSIHADSTLADAPADAPSTAPDIPAPDISVPPCKGKPIGHMCRPASGDCDVEETCTGGDHCPPDTFLPAGTGCRVANGDCDVKETCSGSDRKCPVNGFKPVGSPCRASTGPCDPGETCTGKGNTCPVDLKSAIKKMTFTTTKGTDGHVVKFIPSSYKRETKSVRVYCKPDALVGTQLARGYLSFDTKALSATAVVSSAKLSGCFLGAPNAKSDYAELHPATFKLSAAAIYNATTGTPQTKMPRKNGINTFAVPTSSIKRGALTQYQLRWPVISCTEWTGQVWSGADNSTGLGACGVASYPWQLAVEYCVP